MANRKSSAGAKSSKTKAATTAAKTGERDSLVKLRAHVDDIENRLKRANASTRGSVTALKRAFKTLNVQTGNDQNSSVLAEHIDELSGRLTGLIEITRADVARDLQMVLEDPRIETLKTALHKANQRLTKAETQQAGAIDLINQQIADMAVAVDARLRAETDERKADSVNLHARITEVEVQSTEAIKMIGAKVVTLTEDLTARASSQNDSAAQKLSEKMLSQRQDIEEHKSEVSRRIEAIEDEHRNEVPAIERRLQSLMARLEVLESSYVLPEGGLAASAPPPFDMPPANYNADAYDAPSFDTSAQAVDDVLPLPISSIAPQFDQVDAFTPHETSVVQMVAPPPNPYEAAEAPVMQAYVAPEYQVAGGQAQAQAPMPAPVHSEPDFAPFNMQTGAFEQPGLELQPISAMQSNPYLQAAPPPAGQAAPPPFTQPFEQAGHEQTMDVARPGADLGAKLKSKKRKPKGRSASSGGGLAGISTPVKLAALMTGVAVIGLFGAKTLLPGLMGGEQSQTSQPNAVASASPAAIPPSTNQQGNRDVPLTGSTDRPIQSVDAVGDYSTGMTAPTFTGTNAQTGPQTLAQASDAGNPIAQFQMGLSYLEAGNRPDAVKLIRLSANQGQPAAQYRLAKLYEAGIGVEQDLQTAKKLLERSANSGNRIAMHDLGHFYTTGATDQVVDFSKAVGWFKLAAELDVLDSQFNLGVLYAEGSGVAKDLGESYFWYSVAGRQGDKVAASRAEQLSGALRASEKAAMDAKIKAFTPGKLNEPANGIFRNTPWAPLQSARQAPVKDNTMIVTAQSMLNDLGYSVGVPDGSMGPKTRNAIISFERANGMPQTGRIDQALIERLSRIARS